MDSNSIYGFKTFQFEKIKFNENNNKLPKARSGHRIVATDSDIYSFGGYNPNIEESDPDLSTDDEWLTSKPLFRELWRFSFITKLWTRLQTTGAAPNELASHCATLIGAKHLIIFGGTGVPFGQTSSNKLFVCNLNTNEWNVINCNNSNSVVNECPVEQYGQALTTDHCNDIYVVGGTTGFQYTIDVHKFDLKTHLWQCLYKKNNHFYGEFPEERYRHEIVFYANKLFVMGGGTSYQCYSLSMIPVFDVETRQWTETQTKNDLNVLNEESDGYPKPRRCHDCVHIENIVYLIGGTNGEQIYDDLWRLDLNCMQWSRLPVRIPRAVYFHSAAVSPTGRMSVFGGVTHTNHKERTNELFTIWLQIPSLKEMAFEAILYYLEKNVNKMSNKSIKKLFFDLGVPMNFQIGL